MKNLITSWGGKLVDADEKVSLWPLVPMDEHSNTISGLTPPRIVTRGELQRDYIYTRGVVDGQMQTCYSLRSGGYWYVLGYNAQKGDL